MVICKSSSTMQHEPQRSRMSRNPAASLKELRKSRQRITKRDNTKQSYFLFFNLPPELRNMIYCICLSDERNAQYPDMYQRSWIGSRNRPAGTKDKLNACSRETFDGYRFGHDMYTSRSGSTTRSIFNQGNDQEKSSVAVIDPRGTLVDDLPMLSLVIRQLFQDTFYLFYSTSRDGMWIKWNIRHLDFFPFLRFYQMFNSPLYPVEISPSRLYTAFNQ
ncbi:hypothetical protein EJ02DRAFT_483310 [Clathrospora elynae]|uniref:Uncharacterized protein n=1 Tax=Clathrospora elynae TaxID=706981 RepID=A0A6A5S5A2_9PLEO|nr:hypothetical protein EJ02DRAFT_483310 [Clathrospora elynae]